MPVTQVEKPCAVVEKNDQNGRHAKPVELNPSAGSERAHGGPHFLVIAVFLDNDR